MEVDLLTFSWVSVSAIGTLLAVLVALFYPAWRERNKLTMNAFIGDIVIQWEGPKTILALLVSLTNTGPRPINIVKWGWKVKKRYWKNRKRNTLNVEASLPHKLDFADDYQVYATELDVTPDKIAYIFLMDSTGRKWRVPRRDLREIRKQAQDLSPEERKKLFPAST